MSQIVTVTLNPALDLYTSTERVSDTHKLRCTAPELHPGGGGINVARVLRRLGADCVAIYPAGGSTGAQLRRLLEDEGVGAHCIPIAGDTRESFSVRERQTGREFRFVLPGPLLGTAEWQACWDTIATVARHARWLVASGSLPPGVPVDCHAQLARLARRSECRFVVDSSGPALAAALAEGVFLVKPSLRELRELTGRELAGEADQLQAARDLVNRGQADMVALSLGAAGAMLVTRDLALRAASVAVDVASTIGAGDSFTAGLVWALDCGAPPEDALRHAIAAGAAALLASGTALCQPADVRRLRDRVEVTRLE